MAEKERKSWYEETRKNAIELSRYFGELSLERTIHLLKTKKLNPLLISIDWDAAYSISPQLAKELQDVYLKSLKETFDGVLTEEGVERVPRTQTALLEIRREAAEVVNDRNLSKVEKEIRLLQKIVDFIQSWVTYKSVLPKSTLVSILRKTMAAAADGGLRDSLALLTIFYSVAENAKNENVTINEFKRGVVPTLELLVSSPLPSFLYYVSHYAALIIYRLLHHGVVEEPGSESTAPQSPSPSKSSEMLYKALMSAFNLSVKQILQKASQQRRGADSEAVTSQKDFMSKPYLPVTVKEAAEILRSLMSTWYIEAVSKGAISTGLIHPIVYLIGPRGVGKTTIVDQAATAVGLRVVFLTASAMAREDLQIPVTQVTTMKDLAAGLKEGVNLFDAFFSVVGDRIIDEIELLSSCWELIRKIKEVADKEDLSLERKREALKALWHQQKGDVILGILFLGAHFPGFWEQLVRKRKIDKVKQVLGIVGEQKDLVYVARSKLLDAYSQIVDFLLGAEATKKIKLQLMGGLGEAQKAQQPFVLFIDEVGYNPSVVIAFLAATTHGVFSDVAMPPMFTVVASNIPDVEGAQVPFPPFLARSTILWLQPDVKSTKSFLKDRRVKTTLSLIRNGLADLGYYMTASDEELKAVGLDDNTIKGIKLLREILSQQPSSMPVEPGTSQQLSMLDELIAKIEQAVEIHDGMAGGWQFNFWNLVLEICNLVEGAIARYSSQQPTKQPIESPLTGKTSVLSRFIPLDTVVDIWGSVRELTETFTSRLLEDLGADLQLDFSRMIMSRWAELGERAREHLSRFLERMFQSWTVKLGVIVEGLWDDAQLREYLALGMPTGVAQLKVTPTPRGVNDYILYLSISILKRLFLRLLDEEIKERQQQAQVGKIAEDKILRIDVAKVLNKFKDMLMNVKETPPYEGIPEFKLLWHTVAGAIGEHVGSKFMNALIRFLKEQMGKGEGVEWLIGRIKNLGYTFSLAFYGRPLEYEGQEQMTLKEFLDVEVRQRLEGFLASEDAIVTYIVSNFSTTEQSDSYWRGLKESITRVAQLLRQKGGNEKDIVDGLQDILANYISAGDSLGILFVANSLISLGERSAQLSVTIEELGKELKEKFGKVISKVYDTVVRRIQSAPQDDTNQQLAVAFSNFLGMLVSLPSVGGAGWINELLNLKVITTTWISFLYSVGIATALGVTALREPPEGAIKMVGGVDAIMREIEVARGEGKATEGQEAYIEAIEPVLAKVVTSSVYNIVQLHQSLPRGENALQVVRDLLKDEQKWKNIRNNYLRIASSYMLTTNVKLFDTAKYRDSLDDEWRAYLHPKFANNVATYHKVGLLSVLPPIFRLAWTAVGLERERGGPQKYGYYEVAADAIALGCLLLPLSLFKVRDAANQFVDEIEESKWRDEVDALRLSTQVTMLDEEISWTAFSHFKSLLENVVGKQVSSIDVTSAIAYYLAEKIAQEEGGKVDRVYGELMRKDPYHILPYSALQSQVFGGSTNKMREWTSVVESSTEPFVKEVIGRLLGKIGRERETMVVAIPPAYQPTQGEQPLSGEEDKGQVTQLVKSILQKLVVTYLALKDKEGQKT